MNINEKKLQLLLELKKRGVKDSRVLQTIETIDRSLFLDGVFKPRALEDVPLPIKCGQTISQPSIVAIMTDKLALTTRCKVLEIGTGSGYQTAILSKLSRRVYSVERHQKLKNKAQELLTRNGFRNVTNILGDGTLGIESQAPFDRIILTAAAEDIPQILLKQLRVGGIMVLPIGLPQSDQTLIKLEKTSSKIIFDEIAKVRFLPLVEGIAFQEGV